MLIRTQRMRSASSLAVVCAVGALISAVAHAQDRSFHFDIGTQSLSQALRNFAHVCGQEVVFTEDVVAGQATSLKGEYTVQGALERLLQGTNLVAERSASGAIMIRRRVRETGADVRAPIGFGRTASAEALQVNTANLPQEPAATDTAPPATAPAAPSRTAAAASVPTPPSSLEEVIVTGTKRAENVQSVPNSVFVVTAASMERANIRDFDDLVKISPSLTITKTSQPANNSINIRGIGTYAYSIATESSVAVVVDDIPQAFQAEAFSSFVDVKQVEVLRGPQNTLFGKAASAGVVNITTESPTATFTGRAEVMHTFDDESRYQATVSGPIVDSLRFRLSVNHSEYQGNIYDLSTGTWLNGEQDTTVRGKLVWTPGDLWKVTLSPYFTHTPAGCCAGALYFVSPGVTFAKAKIPVSTVLAGITPSPDNHTARLDTAARGDGRDYGSGLKIERELGSLSLAFISSYDHYDLTDLQDTDGSDFNFQSVAPTAPFGGSANGGYFKITSVTDELRLTSGDTGPFRYVAGLYYSRTGSQRYFVRGSNTLGTFNNLTSLPSTNNITYSAYTSNAVAKNFAVYGQSTYDILEKLALTTGLRVNREKISYNFADYGNHVTYGAPDCSTVSPTLPVSTCNQSTSVTGRASLQYHVTDDIMVFGGYARGYKGLAYDLTSTLTIRTPLASGALKGIPVADAVAAKQPIPAETVNSYEIGFKSTFFDRRLTWNLTAFDEEFQGFQAQSRDDVTGQNVLNSIGRVTSRGVETELAAVIGDFTLNGGGAYDRAVMERFPNATCYSLQTAAQGCVNSQQDLSGKPLFNAPKWNFSFNGQYDVPWTWHDWRPFVSGSYRWQSQVVFNLLQDPDSVQPSYGLFDLALGTQSEHFKLTVFCNNVFDKRYALTRGRNNIFNISQTTSPPTDAISWTPARDSFRYFGIRLGATF
jgi:iron complex outermembrane receptor protein